MIVVLRLVKMSNSVVKMENLFSMLSIKLKDDNISKWAFTLEITQAFLDWESIDMALLSLLLATLFDEAMEYVLGCKIANEAWSNMIDRYASVFKSRVNHLKIELYIIQKGSNSIDKYLLRLKSIIEQLSVAGKFVYEMM
ncbi:hypothetical protein DVH24_013757 [Malus domestica]|uniref:Retrotransposon gag domain-containing protein n=1 Tax=Malus domestica TaxID=3750 RepID=A0A498JIH6_MALDO|nr:hypothetical protein DVH24_013757 [Malus domestica]